MVISSVIAGWYLRGYLNLTLVQLAGLRFDRVPFPPTWSYGKCIADDHDRYYDATLRSLRHRLSPGV